MSPSSGGPPGVRIYPPRWSGRLPGACRCEISRRYRFGRRESPGRERRRLSGRESWVPVSTEIGALRGLGLIGGGIVAAARSDREVARRIDRDLDLPECPVHGVV